MYWGLAASVFLGVFWGHLQVFREVVLWEVDGYFVFMGDSGGLNKHYLGILGCLW